MSDEQWWFNTKTKQAEQGRRSPFTNRIGPYPDKASAEAALDTAAARNEKWEDEDEKWDEQT